MKIAHACPRLCARLPRPGSRLCVSGRLAKAVLTTLSQSPILRTGHVITTFDARPESGTKTRSCISTESSLRRQRTTSTCNCVSRTGGVTQYLRWAGINDAVDDSFDFGINNEKAILFYSNPETRRLYREHVEKLATRRNTITGVLYRDDPAIFGWELINEGQAITGRWAERRAWFEEMSAYLKSMDPNHLIAPGTWGYRSAAERREWLADHAIPTIDYCDVHNYPRPDA